MRRGNVAVLILILGIFIVVLAGLVYKQGFFKLGSDKKVQESTNVLPSPIQSMVADNYPEFDDFIDYKIPDGWKKTSFGKTSFAIQSPDYKDKSGPGYTDLDGMMIVIQKSVNKNNLYNFENLPVGGPGGDGTTEKKIKTKVAGQDAVMFRGGAGYHVLEYGFFKDNYVWEIRFYTSNLNTENKFRKEIDDFITSVRFK